MAHFRLIRDDGLIVAEFDYDPTPDPVTLPEPVTEINSTMSLADIQLAINMKEAGTVAFAAGTYAQGVLTGQNGLMYYARGPVHGLSFDMNNTSDWTIRGRTDAAGFQFTGSIPIRANNAVRGNVLYNVFIDVPTNGYDGAAIAMNGASFMYVANNDFIRCQGNVLGMYNMTDITFDGNHFTDCFECIAIQEPLQPDSSLGKNFKITKNVFLRTQRAAVEVGPGGSQFYSGMVVNDNFFDDFNNAGEEGTLLAISLVGQAAENTEVARNFIKRGVYVAGVTATAIEFTGTGDCSENTVINFDYTGLTYQSGWDVHDNSVWNDPGVPFFGWANNGSGSGTFRNVNYLSEMPATPPWPVRTVY